MNEAISDASCHYRMQNMSGQRQTCDSLPFIAHMSTTVLTQLTTFINLIARETMYLIDSCYQNQYDDTIINYKMANG